MYFFCTHVKLVLQSYQSSKKCTNIDMQKKPCVFTKLTMRLLVCCQFSAMHENFAANACDSTPIFIKTTMTSLSFHAQCFYFAGYKSTLTVFCCLEEFNTISTNMARGCRRGHGRDCRRGCGGGCSLSSPLSSSSTTATATTYDPKTPFVVKIPLQSSSQYKYKPMVQDEAEM